MENQYDIGKRIRIFRIVKGYTQEALAFEAGINPAFLGHLERGIKSPTMTTLEKIVDALGITFGQLFADEINLGQKAIDQEKSEAFEQIMFSVEGLSAESLGKIADIVKNIVLLMGTK